MVRKPVALDTNTRQIPHTQDRCSCAPQAIDFDIRHLKIYFRVGSLLSLCYRDSECAFPIIIYSSGILIWLLSPIICTLYYSVNTTNFESCLSGCDYFPFVWVRTLSIPIAVFFANRISCTLKEGETIVSDQPRCSSHPSTHIASESCSIQSRQALTD